MYGEGYICYVYILSCFLSFLLLSHYIPFIYIIIQVAEWIKFSVTELELFCKKYEEEEKKEREKVMQR